DRSGKAVVEARRTCARVAVADFFHVHPGCTLSRDLTLPSRFDSIIGNPPYIRQELLGDHKPTIGRLFELTDVRTGDKEQTTRPAEFGGRERICGEVPESISVPRWSGRSDIYVYFFGHASAFLKAGGRLVFLTSSSWLDVAYGIQLQ